MPSQLQVQPNLHVVRIVFMLTRYFVLRSSVETTLGTCTYYGVYLYKRT